ncbi:DUF4303 domain-containing protein [Lysinibacillus piscis]|uniref:DUF4303 domain-containing protein n=1 Tax=Lysinibacillus piscis TaxID=2518931 RepID=A0ABQ5NFF3_9BACI|nr:DUF4303 domain-containing protein [Lysinibacillus sp. KH24]GLC87114.1 hypothetical protein LYSBPC_02410 [Lysinibacillus sp. KH24]
MKQKMKQAVYEAYIAMYDALKDEQIYAVVLVTDGDCGSLYLTMGTEKSLLQIGNNYEDNPEDYRFLKDEFLYEDDTDMLQQISRELLDRVLNAGNPFVEHKMEIQQMMSDIMYELKQEGVIAEHLFTFISITDDKAEELLEIASAKRCNPNHPLLSKFLHNWQR